MTTTRGRAASAGLRRVAGLVGVLLAASLALGACGNEGGSGTGSEGEAPDPAAGTTSEPTETPSGTPTEPATASPTESAPATEEPQCTDVWVAGEKLPGGYQDCYDGDQRVKADGRYCEFGKPLVTYSDTYWAVPGGPVHQVEGALLDDADYAKALRQCSG